MLEKNCINLCQLILLPNIKVYYFHSIGIYKRLHYGKYVTFEYKRVNFQVGVINEQSEFSRIADDVKNTVTNGGLVFYAKRL